jgi:hypothetical protein
VTAVSTVEAYFARFDESRVRFEAVEV